MLLTGDNRRAAERVAAELGVSEVHAGVLPNEKAEVVRRLQRDGRVAMVGDGINDAPSLMQADVLAVRIESRRPPMMTMSADSMAMSVPAPMATPAEGSRFR